MNELATMTKHLEAALKDYRHHAMVATWFNKLPRIWVVDQNHLFDLLLTVARRREQYQRHGKGKNCQEYRSWQEASQKLRQHKADLF